jgi:hypothetical protein
MDVSFFRKAKGLATPYLRAIARAHRTERNAVENELETSHTSRDGKGWNHYNSPATEYYRDDKNSFGDIVTKEDASEHIRRLRESIGAPIAVIDVFGQVQASADIGADVSIGWTLVNTSTIKAFERHFRQRPYPQHKEEMVDQQRIMYYGGVFDTDQRADALKTLSSDLTSTKSKLGLITFRPYGGAAAYANNPAAQIKLYDAVLRPLFEQLVEGGRVYLNSSLLIGMPFLQVILEEQHGITFKANAAGTTYVIEKTSGSASLEAFRHVMRRHPEWREEFKELKYAGAQSAARKYLMKYLDWYRGE